MPAPLKTLALGRVTLTRRASVRSPRNLRSMEDSMEDRGQGSEVYVMADSKTGGARRFEFEGNAGAGVRET